LDQAIAYGDMLTVDVGHLDYWTELAQRGGAALRAAGLPTAPCWSDYDEWPRGRVLYDTLGRRFVIRADRKLHTANLLKRIASQFAINPRDAHVRPDEHYQSVRTFARQS
jgi:hypothetical protein